MTNDFGGIGMVDANEAIVGNKVVADGLRRFLARGKGHYANH